MASASRELQKVILDALVADAGLGALIGNRIYDRMPTDGEYPCITFGPADEIPDDADCISGEEHSVQLDVWSRDQGRLGPCKDITAAAKAALHDAALTMPTPYALCFIRVASTRVFIDRDGITAHGVVSVQAMVEL